jgi:hypothetical protein
MHSFSILLLMFSPIHIAENFMFWKKKGGKGGGGGGQQRDYAAEQRARVQSGQARVDSAFTPFDDSFYDARKQAYIDYYKPEYDRQSTEAEAMLTKQLASRNQLASSYGAREQANLQSERDKVWANILAGAENYDMSNRTNLSSAKQRLMGMAGNMDDEALSRMAIDEASLHSKSPVFSSIGQLFANLTTPAAMGLARGGGTPMTDTTVSSPYSTGNPVIPGTPNVSRRRGANGVVVG